MTKYEKLLNKYEQSGLTQKAFAIHEGMSAGTLHNYIKRGKEERTKKSNSLFTTLEVSSRHEKKMLIRTSSGLEIEIPL